MRQLPTGTVTFLFTDIEGSTRLLQELGERYADALAEHRRALREACARFSGVEVDTQGDALFIAFARATDAASAALEGQRALAGGRVRVRMGLHTGEPIVTDEGYVGIDVHNGARVMAAGHGGQVLMSQTTRDLLPPSFVVRDLGEQRLKDLTARHLYQLGDGHFPPLKTLHQTNLPVTPTPLIGRERELAELATKLQGHRLLTLVGPGGTGKTRLAMQAAADAVDHFEDGIWWVPLAAVIDPRTVESAIATALHADGPLDAHLRTQQALLLLDNFEQIMAAAPRISALLEAAPNVRVLVTSREPLRIGGEHRYAVDPLEQADAVTLFVERARDVDPNFTHDGAVAEICRRLEGLPLAVELAAARVGVLEPAELLARLDRALPLLTGGRRDAPDRQRTLRATIEWSHDLLDASERELFTKLAVFAGGFTLEAAEAVCGAELDVLQSLVDKCLVRRRWSSDPRFLMLETVREFAVEQLEAWEGREGLRRRHAEYFLTVAESTNLAVETFHRGTRFDIALMEQENFRAALAWTLAAGETTRGLQIATALENLWVANDPREGIRWFRALFEHADETPSQIRGSALRAFGGANDIAGEQLAALELYQAGLAVFEALDDDIGRARLLHRVALSAMRRGDLERATELAEQSLALHRKVGNPFGEAEAIAALGAVARDRGDRARAFELLDRSASIVGELGIVWWEQGMLAELAALDLAEGRIAEAERRAREALTIAARIRDRGGRVFGVGLLGRVAAERGEQERAGRLWGSIETEAVGAPNGGWIRHRPEFEARVLASATPEFERGRATGREWSLDEAVEYALA